MTPPELIANSGYALIVIGTFFEGELVMLAAGMAAAAGLLSIPMVIACGMTGIFLSDTVCFLIGRLAGTRLSRWFPRLYARAGGIFRLVEQHDEKLLIFFQFFPGLCTITPVAFGMSKISVGRFMILDLVGNATWTLAFTLGGFFFGSAMGKLVTQAQPWLIASSYAVVFGLLAVAVWRFRRIAGRKLGA